MSAARRRPSHPANRFDRLTAEELRAHRETVLLRLLIRTSQAETNELVARLAESGYLGVTPTAIGLLGNVDTEGTRIVALAGRLGTTRQAVSQLVADLEGKGFLERVPDPDDGRAVLVRHTAQGRLLLDDALAAMADIEAGYADAIGADRLAELKATLAALAVVADPTSGLGRR